jgi:hypothetical protein
MSVSPVFEINCLVRCRSGRLLRTEDKTQFFFDHQGNVHCAILSPLIAQRLISEVACVCVCVCAAVAVEQAKHAILCLLSWQEGTLRDDEVLDRWLPIAPFPEQ